MKDKLKQSIRTALWNLLEADDRWRFDGICATIEEQVDSDYENSRESTSFCAWSDMESWLKLQFTKWPEYSGNVNYPVKAPHKYKEIGFFGSIECSSFWHLPLWEGEYGESRIRLVMFLIQQLDN